MSGDYEMRELTENFAQVEFHHSPTALDYEEFFQKGFSPLFPPTERVCNRESTWTVIFKADLDRTQLKEAVKHCIHHLRSLLDSEKDFEESSLVATKAYEALEKL